MFHHVFSKFLYCCVVHLLEIEDVSHKVNQHVLKAPSTEHQH